MKLVKPEQWYVLWWGIAGTAYLTGQLVGTYFVVKWAIVAALGHAL